MWDKFIVTEPKVSLNCFASLLSLAFPSKCLADDLIVLNAFLPTLQWPPMCKRPLSPLSLCSCLLLTFLFFSCSYPPFPQKSRKTLLTCRSEFVSFLQNTLYFRWTLGWSLHPLSAASHTGPGHIGLSSSEPNDGRCHYKLFYYAWIIPQIRWTHCNQGLCCGFSSAWNVSCWNFCLASTSMASLQRGLSWTPHPKG